MAKKKSKNTNDTEPIQKTVSRIQDNISNSQGSTSDSSLLFGKKNYMFLLIGLLLILIGYLLMAGGSMPSPDVWDDSLIYSARRTVVAPIFILAGLIIQVYTIFSRK